MQPNNTQWDKYLLELDRLKNEELIDDESHAILRYSSVAPTEMMATTQGDVEGLNRDKFEVILTKVKADLVNEKQKEVEIEKKKNREIQKKLDVKNAQVETHAKKAQIEQRHQEDLKIEKIDLTKKLEKQTVRVTKLEKWQKSTDERLQNRVLIIMNIIFISISLFFIYLTIYASENTYVKVILGIISLANIILGFSLNKIKLPIQQYIAKFFS